ncbi:MAG: hypothetical protein HYX90_01485 [Chloroflexi bacterium]|nr:hypothetical protein [Chloroflexota bacterium]
MYSVVWPRGNQVIEEGRPARRLDDLNGKTVAELWTWIYRGDHVFPSMEREMTKRYPDIKFVSYREFGSIHGADEANVLAGLHRKLKENKCDAAVAGMGC